MQDKTFKQLLMSSNYYALNKQIVKSLGIESAFLLTILIEASDGLADEDGWFYQTIEKIEELTGIGRHKQDKIIKDLIELKILEQKNKGVPCKRYFKINYSMIENLVFLSPQTSLSEIGKLGCKKETNWSAEKRQTRLSEIDNNKEYIINNLNKELNHKEHKSYEHEFANDDLKKIKQWFDEVGIDFSKKHKAKVIELLKNNSVAFLLYNFREQYEILKNKPEVKNIAAVFSNHLFKGTCEVNSVLIIEKENKIKQDKANERKESEKIETILEKFKRLDLVKQEEIIQEIIRGSPLPNLKEIRKNAPNIFLNMIHREIGKKMKGLNYGINSD